MFLSGEKEKHGSLLVGDFLLLLLVGFYLLSEFSLFVGLVCFFSFLYGEWGGL